jgi:hypothetical protein
MSQNEDNKSKGAEAKKSLFDLIDKGFDMMDEALDTVESIGKGVKYHTDDEPDELEGTKEGVIDAEFTEVSTKVEVPHPVEHHPTAPTEKNRDLILGVTKPDYHNHLFHGISNDAICGLVFAPGDIVGRTTLDRTAKHKAVLCIGCLSIAIQGK